MNKLQREGPDEEKKAQEQAYSHYAPAYQLGHTLASNRPQQKVTWRQVEEEARQTWRNNHTRPWEEYAAVIQHAWNEVRHAVPLSASEPMLPKDPAVDSIEHQFYRHFEEHYQPGGHTYRQVAPVYHFGYDLAVDQRHQDRNWQEIQAQAQELWNRQSTNFVWSDAEKAVAYAWRITRDQPLGWPRHVSEFEGFSSLFYDHYRGDETESTGSYADRAPAYYLGYDLAMEEAYGGEAWASIKPLAQKRWPALGSPLAWADVEEAVHYAWQTVNNRLKIRESEKVGIQYGEA